MLATAAAMDTALPTERRVRPWQKRTYPAGIELLPDGTLVGLDGVAWLLHAGRLYAWTAEGYVESRPCPASAEVAVLTPPSIIAVLRAGYRPGVHPSASSGGKPPGC